MDPAVRTLNAPVTGDPPSPIDPPTGCRYRTRCPNAEALCAASKPGLAGAVSAFTAAGEVPHLVACHMLQAASGHSLAPVFTQGIS
jgi:peptide/nickel transport system ATP-binding protein